MSTPSAAVIDALNSLLEAEANSIFHFVGAGSPYLDHAGPEIRQPLEEMRRHLDQHEQELSHLIRDLGGEPSTPPKPSAEDQYLNYLSLKFLLPKLVDAKQLMIQRYQNVLGAIDKDPKVTQILQKHLEEMEKDLGRLHEIAGVRTT
jgi:Ferritin-like domain